MADTILHLDKGRKMTNLPQPKSVGLEGTKKVQNGPPRAIKPNGATLMAKGKGAGRKTRNPAGLKARKMH